MINTCFDSGQVDDSLYTPQSVDFTPAYTYAGLAQGNRGADGRPGASHRTLADVDGPVGVQARMLRHQGEYGMLGALIVLTTMSGVSLDNTLVATLSTGFPIGLGVYLAWANRAWSAETETTGFAPAMSGALIGARLGFNAGEGPPAIATAIVGAGVVHT
jgi:hypothetical protein